MEHERDVSMFAAGQEAEKLMKLLGPYAVERMQSVDRRVFAVLTSGKTLSAEMAVQAWYEKYALHSLFQSLSKKVNAGRTAAVQLMEGQDGQEE